MARRAFSIAILLALPALAACGDSGPSKEDFLAEADPICKRGNDIAVVFTTPSDLPMIKEFATKMADNVDKTVGEVDKLDFPGGEDAKGAKDFVQAMKDASAAARAVIPDVDGKKYPAVETGVTKMVDAFKAADTKARTYGSKECGRGEAEAAGKLGTTANATVKNAFIAQADAICAAAGKEIDAIAEPETPAETRDAMNKTTAVIEKMVADIKAIPAPQTDYQKLTDFFVSTDATVAKFKEGAEIAASNDLRKFEKWIEELGTVGDTSDAKGDAYGFKDCGSQGA